MRIRALCAAAATLVVAASLVRCGSNPSDQPDAATQSGHDVGAGASGLDASATGPCCVVFTLGDGGSLQYCQGPATSGPSSAATPTIGTAATPPYGSQLRLHAGLSSSKSDTSALHVTVYEQPDAGAMHAGTFTNPQIDYFGPTSGWWENNASNGSITLDSWTAAGTQINGTFDGQIYDSSGSGGLQAIHGTFCAVRAADL